MKKSVKHEKTKKKLTKKPKNNLRARTKYAAFKPSLNLRTRYEELADISEYINDLPEKAKQWMNSFVSEFVHADFNHGGTIRHKTKKLRNACYNKNNARNRDVLTQAKAQGTAVVFSQINDKDDSVDEMDRMIEALDRKKRGFSGKD